VNRAWLLLLAACGRLGFDAPSSGDGSVAPDATGSAGARWVAVLGNNAMYFPVTGASGEVAVTYSFQGSTQIPGQTLTGMATQTSSAVVRFDAAGAVRSATVLDATYTCDARGLAMRGDDVLVAAFTSGGATSSLGACSVSTSHQDPVVLAVDGAGTTALHVHGASAGANAQAWNIGVLADSTIVTSGIYSSGLSFGSTSLPTAGFDPNAFVAHIDDSQATALWALGLTAGVQITAGPLAVEGNDTCMLGAYNGSGLTELGTALPHAGKVDDFVARLDATGTPRFVRGFGSTQQDSEFNDGSLVATAGGCIAAIQAPGDVTIDSTTLAVSDGAAIVATFDSAGTLAGGFRTPAEAQLAVVGGKVVAAYAVTAPVTIGGATITPQGTDTIVVEIGPQGPTRLLGVVAGAGEQTPVSLAAIAPDALAIGLQTTGELTFGTHTVQTSAGDHAVAVLGI
jgi:hypothetical protein